MTHQCERIDTYDVVGFGRLAGSRVGSLPSHSNGVAAVPNVEGVERNLRLRALGVHEVLATCERDAVDLDWSLVAPVTDDVDRGGVVLEVRGQSRKCKGLGVVLDKLAEDLGTLICLLVCDAVAGTVVSAIVLPRCGRADFFVWIVTNHWLGWCWRGRADIDRSAVWRGLGRTDIDRSRRVGVLRSGWANFVFVLLAIAAVALTMPLIRRHGESH